MIPIGIALAALAAGTAAQVTGQRKVQRAQRRASAQYATDMDKREADARGLFERALGQQDAGGQQAAIASAAADKVQRVDNLVQGNEAYVNPALPGQDKAPAVIKSQISSKLADELARARAQIAAAAQIEGYSTRTFDRGLQLGRVKPELGNIGLFAQGDQNVYNARMAAAPGKGATWSTIGDLLTAAGQIGLLAGGPGASVVGKGAGAMDSGLAGSNAAKLFESGVRLA